MLWVFGSLVLAAAMAPWLYQAGKWLGMAARDHELPAAVEWVAAACERSDLSRYFSRSMALAAVLLLPLVRQRVKWIERKHGAVKPVKQPTRWQRVVVEVCVGFVIAAGMLWTAGMVFEAMGAFTPKEYALGYGKLIQRILVPTLAVPVVEEWLFRGLLLGLWLRCSRPFYACLGTSLVFAFVHFLKVPDGVLMSHPASLFAGFELLGRILLHFTEPRFFIMDFLTLAAVGMILGWARLRTGALWFSMGLHAGWIFTFKGFSLLHQRSWTGTSQPWQIGGNLLSGLYPLTALAVTAVICHFVLRWLRPPEPR